MPCTLIDYYKAIEDGSSHMLAAAQASDWPQLTDWEQACAELIAQLQEKSRSETLQPAHRPEKMRILQRILRNDAQIRYLAEPWMQPFERQFGDTRPLKRHVA